MFDQWVKWHPKGHLILAGSDDSTVWMWNADKVAYLNMFSGHASTVTCGDFTPDGNSLKVNHNNESCAFVLFSFLLKLDLAVLVFIFGYFR